MKGEGGGRRLWGRGARLQPIDAAAARLVLGPHPLDRLLQRAPAPLEAPREESPSPEGLWGRKHATTTEEDEDEDEEEEEEEDELNMMKQTEEGDEEEEEEEEEEAENMKMEKEKDEKK